MTPLLMAAGMVSALASVMAAITLAGLKRRERLQRRFQLVRHASRSAGGGSELSDPAHLIRFIAGAGAAVARSGLLSTATLQQLEQTLSSAGLRGSTGLGFFVGSKLMLVIIAPLVAWLSLRHAISATAALNLSLVAAAVIGLLLPDFVIRRRRARYLRRLQAGLADAMDMMVICAEAGLGLESAFQRVAAEIGYAHPAVAEEMTRTASELRIAADRRSALLNMGERTGLESLKRLGSTLVQTHKYGTPLSQSLRILSVELREEMLIRFEANAARLPVLLTIPMIIFILPTVFIIVGGPAMLAVLQSIYH